MVVGLFVLAVGDRLVAQNLLVRFACLGQRRLSRALGIDRKKRELPFQFLAVARRAVRKAGVAHEGLELMPTRATEIFIKGHGLILQQR